MSLNYIHSFTRLNQTLFRYHLRGMYYCASKLLIFSNLNFLLAFFLRLSSALRTNELKMNGLDWEQQKNEID